MTAIPVADVNRARDFYEGVLGLRFLGGPRADGSLDYECGSGTGLFTYPTQENAGKSPAHSPRGRSTTSKRPQTRFGIGASP